LARLIQFFVLENNDLQEKLTPRHGRGGDDRILNRFQFQVGLSLHGETLFSQCRVAAAIL
jgi:hypothetical protein